MKEKQRGDGHRLYCPTCKAGRNCMDHLMIRENDLQEQVTQLKADLATATQGLERIRDMDYRGNRHSSADLAQQTLDKIGKE